MSDFNAKSEATYNKIANDYDDSFDGKFTRKFKRLLAENIYLEDNIKVLDVACGNGSLLALLSEQKAILGFGVDLSAQMIKNAAASNPDMEFYTAGCEAMPIENDTIDLITVSAAYHHFPDVKAFAKEARRVLKANGKIYIAEIYLNPVLRIICNPFVPLSRAGDVKFYSSNQIINNFNQFGFEKMDVIVSEGVQIVSLKKQ